MTGVERNADVVEMATYAPLFAHIDGWQWRPDMIWYDNLRSFRSCSYYVQQMYSLTKGTNVVPLTWDGKPVEGLDNQQGLFASANFDKNEKCYYVKIVNTSDKAQNITLNLKGMKGEHQGQLMTFHSDNLDGENTLADPVQIVPQVTTLQVTAPTFGVTIGPKTFNVYKINK